VIGPCPLHRGVIPLNHPNLRIYSYSTMVWWNLLEKTMPNLSLLLMVMHKGASNLGIDISSPYCCMVLLSENLSLVHSCYWWRWHHLRHLLLIGITIGFYILRFLQSSARPIHLPFHAHSCLLDGVHNQCPCLNIL
jgi:hypothetical protein